MKLKVNECARLAVERCYAKTPDLMHPDANMYGCFPCPVCKSIYRWPTQQGTVRCDDCGLATPGWRLDLPAPLAVNDRPVRRAGLLRVK